MFLMYTGLAPIRQIFDPTQLLKDVASLIWNLAFPSLTFIDLDN